MSRVSSTSAMPLDSGPGLRGHLFSLGILSPACPVHVLFRYVPFPPLSFSPEEACLFLRKSVAAL